MFGLSLGLKSLTSEGIKTLQTDLKSIDNQAFSEFKNSFSLDFINLEDMSLDLPTLELDSLPIVEDLIQQAQDGNVLPLLSFIADLPAEQFQQIQIGLATHLANKPDIANALSQIQNLLSQTQQGNQLKSELPVINLSEAEKPILIKDFLPKDLENITARLEQLFQQTNTIKTVVTEKVDRLSNVNIETNHHLLSPVNTTQQNLSNTQTQTTRLITPIDNTSWSNQFAERVTMLVGQQQHAARIKINPPELGPIEVKINIQNDQANVTVLAQHQVVRDSLEDSMPRLRELLQQQGIALGDFNVASDGSEKGQEQYANGNVEWSFSEDISSQEQTQQTIVHEDLLVNAYV